MASQTEQCGGHCVCIEYDGKTFLADDAGGYVVITSKLLQAGSNGKCPTGSVPITNTKGEIEAQLDACACANRLVDCLCAEYLAATPA